MPKKFIPVREFAWGEPSVLHAMTCKNHPTAAYLTKNPWERGIHFVKGADEFPYGVECPCPFDDLVVVVDE
jgi:hypothetical protein